ncbi:MULTISPECIES: lysoplasmalogenase [unclassified Microbulbifer]|uniref:lysoplasmalogenase n=1 Tax=unclassified Microbulbifer TaxID=2619833 RepID=UPI0027E4932E|nr:MULTISPECIES: lysoplasmalogenase [unclassified Microbulbifer]
MTESPATVASPLSRSLSRPLLAFTACAAIYMVLDAYGLRGPWMASMKIVPIAILALLALRSLGGFTRTLTLCALTFSALGDLLLALEFSNGFVYGLGAFLLAQLIYAGNFLRAADFRSRRTALRGVPVLITALLLARVLLPAAEELAPAVLVYLLAIVIMALCAAAHRGDSALLFAGAVTFMVSDTLIALNKFVIPLPMAGTAIMVTYYGAQLALLYGLARARA